MALPSSGLLGLSQIHDELDGGLSLLAYRGRTYYRGRTPVTISQQPRISEFYGLGRYNYLPVGAGFEFHGSPADRRYPGSGDGHETTWCGGGYNGTASFTGSPGAALPEHGTTCAAPTALAGPSQITWLGTGINWSLAGQRIAPRSVWRCRFWASFNVVGNNFDSSFDLTTDWAGNLAMQRRDVMSGAIPLCNDSLFWTPILGNTMYPVMAGQVRVLIEPTYLAVLFGYRVHPGTKGNCYCRLERVS